VLALVIGFVGTWLIPGAPKVDQRELIAVKKQFEQHPYLKLPPALLEGLDDDAKDEIDRLRTAHDVVILDRYVASNAAYSAARLDQPADGEVVDWVFRLEYQRLQLPAPDWQLLLDVSPELAGERALARAEQDASRARDAYERDGGLQQRTAAVYSGLADADWGGPWLRVAPGAGADEVIAALG